MTINETKSFVEACHIVDAAPLITGLHGLGKSDIVKQFATEQDLHCETLILSLMDVSDLMGMPRTAEVGGQITTVWAGADWYNRVINAAFPPSVNFDDLSFASDEIKSFVIDRIDTSSSIDRASLNALYCEFTGEINDMLHLITQDLITYSKAKRSVIFLDEFNRAPVDILNASLQLVLDKRLHSHLLPIVDGKPTFVVAAINPADQDYTVNTFDPALLDRFTHCTVEADATAWLDWARTANVNSIVRDFIAEHPDRIHWTPADGGVGATPRSWTKLASFVDKIDKIPDVVQFQIFKGCIG